MADEEELERYLTIRTAEICDEWGYDVHPIVTLNPRLSSTLGQCHRRNPPLIELNENFVKLNSAGAVECLLKHEIVHILFAHHDKAFKEECKRGGIPYHVHLQHEIKQTAKKYVLECECGYKWTTDRKTDGFRLCPFCHRVLKQRERKEEDEIITCRAEKK